MFGKMKRWFGIEGVKIELIVPEEVSLKVGVVKGELLIGTMHTQTVSAVKIRMIETYKRGRKEDMRIDDYEIGSLFLDEAMEVEGENPLMIEFVLPFEVLKSEIDEFANKNFFAKGIANLAKRTRNVQSTYRIEVEAYVAGTKLNPFDKKTIKLV